jgi:hypothetical protein
VVNGPVVLWLQRHSSSSIRSRHTHCKPAAAGRANLIIFRSILKLDASQSLIFIYVYLIGIQFCVTSVTNEMRYSNDVLQCYTLVIHCSSGILSSLATASRLFNGEPLVSWPRVPSSHTLKRNRKHMWGVEVFPPVRVTRQSMSQLKPLEQTSECFGCIWWPLL